MTAAAHLIACQAVEVDPATTHKLIDFVYMASTGCFMNERECMVRVNSIIRRQKSGEITPSVAAAEFDALLDTIGDLHFYSDTTCMRANWGGEQVMVFPKDVNGGQCAENMSNTGIITQGPRRGSIVTHPVGQTCACSPEVLSHFMKLSAGNVTEK